MDFFNSLLKKLEKPREDSPESDEQYLTEQRLTEQPNENFQSRRPELTEKKQVVSIEDLSAQLDYGKRLLSSAANPFDREYYKGVVATLEHLLQSLNFKQDVLGRYLHYAERSSSMAVQSLEREYFKGVIATLRHLQEQTLKQV